MKRKRFHIEGIDEVMKRIEKEMNKKSVNITSTGFIRISMLVRNDMEANFPRIPLDTGNLRASYFTTLKDSRNRTQDVGSGFDSTTTGKSAEEKQAQAAFVSLMRQTVNASKKPLMIFGFSANYAKAVHEMKGNVNWKRPGSGSKFFEKSLQRLEKQIINILADSA